MPRIHALLSMICKNNKIYADYAFFKETQMQSSNPAISVIRKMQVYTTSVELKLVQPFLVLQPNQLC